MTTMTGMHDTGSSNTQPGVDDVALFASGIAFPADRSDLLLQAIVSHATPRLIGELRSLPDAVYADADALVEALSDE